MNVDDYSTIRQCDKPINTFRGQQRTDLLNIDGPSSYTCSGIA